MRRLLLLVAVLVFVDTMLYAALTPLLPHFTHEFALSKLRAGILVAAYPAGALVGGLPGGAAAARLGPRRAVVVGLVGMGLASLGFAVAGGFWGLFSARLLQGLGSAFTWAGAFSWLLAAAPRERRGALLGSAMGAAVFGALFGPVVGAAAALVGRAAIFAALAGLSVFLIAATLRLEPAPVEHPSVAAIARALRDYRFGAGLGLMALASLVFGILSVLGPLRLSAAGWGAAGIGVVWLIGAAVETIGSPLAGRLVDRRGRLLPVRALLVFGAALELALAVGPRPLFYVPLIVISAAVFGVLFTPAFALIADGAENVALPQGMAFGFMSAAWAVGGFVGPAAAGAIAGATSDWIPFVLAAGVCAVAFAVARPASDHVGAAVVVDRLPGDAAGVRGE
jgi:MFS family permease